MNQEIDTQRPGDEGDPGVSAAYRAMASERTPAHLDAAMLQEAGAAARADRSVWRRSNWFRPLAFVAMAGLSLAIVLELTRTAPVEAPRGPVTEAGGVAPRQAPPRDRAAAQPRADRPASPSVVDDIASAADASGGRLQDVAETAESALMLPQAVVPAAADQDCDDEQKADAQSWLGCVEALRLAGRDDAADRELERLAAAFPDFLPAQ